MLRVIYAVLKSRKPYRDPQTDYEAIMVQRNAPRWITMLQKHDIHPLTGLPLPNPPPDLTRGSPPRRTSHIALAPSAPSYRHRHSPETSAPTLNRARTCYTGTASEAGVLWRLLLWGWVKGAVSTASRRSWLRRLCRCVAWWGSAALPGRGCRLKSAFQAVSAVAEGGVAVSGELSRRAGLSWALPVASGCRPLSRLNERKTRWQRTSFAACRFRGESVKGGLAPGLAPLSQEEQRESALAAVLDGVYGSAAYQVMWRVPIRGAKRRSDPGVGRTLGEV